MSSTSGVTKNNNSQATHWKVRVLCQSLPLICLFGVIAVAIIAGVMGDTMALKVLFHVVCITPRHDIRRARADIS